MAIIDHDAALSRAGANITGFWSQAAFLARRYPLGAVGANQYRTVCQRIDNGRTVEILISHDHLGFRTAK